VGRFLQYLDFFFTPAGNDLLNWGVEGVSYTVENGEKQYTDKVLKDPNYEVSTALSQFALPTFVGIQSADAQLKLYTEAQQAFSTVWSTCDSTFALEPFIAFTPEEIEVNTAKQTDLTTTRDSWRDKFITGEKSIETDWETYLGELKSFGVDDLTAIRQAASDRYQAK
jgi:putative aldouronate transport system substrate-binding protein